MPAPSTFKIDTSAPVLVTGATGYVAGELIKQLLEAGVSVHAAVRDPSNPTKVGHLTAMGGDLKLFKADLLDQGSYAEAMAGCSVVFHTASPFTSNYKDPQRDMVDPAVKGTENIMASAAQTDSVKRVVLTSSCVSIYGDAQDIVVYPGGVMTEAQWNTTSTLNHQTYSYSKVMAERRAWEMAEADGVDLVVINPGFVIGPGTMEQPTSESFNLMKQMTDGTMAMGAPDMNMGCVDVRDVALAHIRAAYTPEAEGRHICVAEEWRFVDMGIALQEDAGMKKAPKRLLPSWLLKLVGPMMNKLMTREFLTKNLGYAWAFDNSKIKHALGIEFRPIRSALAAMAKQVQAKA